MRLEITHQKTFEISAAFRAVIILDKIVAKKLTPYGKIIPRAPVAMLKREIVLPISYRPPTLKGGAWEEYRFAKGFNLANPKRCIS